jgi:hypothetical protein
MVSANAIMYENREAPTSLLTYKELVFVWPKPSIVELKTERLQLLY